MDNRDRDNFYMSTPDDAAEGDEYELEPPDAEVQAREEHRAKKTIEESQVSIDIDEIYRDTGRERSSEIVENWFRNFRFRFQVKHLLIATAVLAIVLTLRAHGMLGTALVLLVMFSIAGVYFYLQWEEKKAQDEANRRRYEVYERRRAHFERTSDTSTAGETDELQSGSQPRTVPEPLPNEVDQTWQEALARDKFRFRFSMAELMIAMTTAAVIFGLVQILGGASNTATLLGFLALLGLVVHALGFEPPGIVILGWWLILVLYVLLSIAAAVWSGLA